MAKTDRYLSFAPPYYVILFVFVILTLGYMMLKAFSDDGIGLISVSLIFGFLFLSGLVMSQRLLLKQRETFTESCQGWLMGFIAWIIIMSLKHVLPVFSFVRFPSQSALSTLQTSIPPIWKFLGDVLMAPVVEELFWGIGLPLSIFVLFSMLGREYPLFKNKLLQFGTVILLGGLTFAAFHTSATQFGFFIAAMSFRTFQTVIVYGDEKYDIIPNYAVPYSFLVGTHMANNLFAYNLGEAFLLLLTNPFGITTMLIFTAITGVAIRGFLIKFIKR